MFGPGLISVGGIIEFLTSLGWREILGSIIAGIVILLLGWIGSKVYQSTFGNAIDHQERETTIKYMAESVVPLEDQLVQHREKLGEDPMDSDIV